MNLERAKELLALRLYDELSPEESAELERLLARSEEARNYARELERGLGTWKAAAERETAPELPTSWSERLREETRELPPRRAVWRTVATFAAGLAAGLLLTWANRPEPEVEPPDPAPGPMELAGAISPPFDPRPFPPPKATGGGALSRRGIRTGR